ncbi:MAG TPA: hypothetical protein VGX23_02765 [Actinocrinis sp.]|nr:hypothetical protein [Actinocrinis sp.]
MINPRRAAAAAAAALALGALAAPASAATRNAAAGSPQSQTIAAGSRIVPSAVGAFTSLSVSPDFSTCAVSEFGYGGQTICGTFGFEDYNPNAGNDEAFVIGLDWSIWHAWPGSNGWHSLGGQALHATGNGVGEFSNNPFTIDTIGTDGNRYCRTWPWTAGWKRC